LTPVERVPQAIPSQSRTRHSKGYPLLLVGVVGVLSIIALFLYQTRPGPCDSIFEQTAPELETTIHFLQSSGNMVIGPEKVQELTESSQAIGIRCKTCCIAQQSGKIDAKQFQTCLDITETTKSFEKQILQVKDSVDAANIAQQQGQEQVMNQKIQQARMATDTAQKLAANIETINSAVEATPASEPTQTASDQQTFKVQMRQYVIGGYCERSGQSINCPLTITNLGVDKRSTILAINGTQFYDSQHGIKYNASQVSLNEAHNGMSIYDAFARADLTQGLPAIGQVIFDNVPPEVIGIHELDIQMVAENTGFEIKTGEIPIR
jgi:hypothetical protein